MTKSLRADLFLLLVALIWGGTFPLISLCLQYIGPFLFVSFRFGLASVILLIWVYPRLKQTTRPLLKVSLILGILNSGVYLFQTYGMRDLDSDTAAFIAAIGVIFVPFLSAAFGLAKVKKIEIVGSVFCLAGLYVLTGAEVKSLSWSEAAILFASFCWALGVCYLQRASARVNNPQLLTFYQVIFMLPMLFMMAGTHYQAPILKPVLIFTIFYTAILGTIVVFFLQARFQKDTTATHAAIIYSLEPVLATIIAVWVDDLPITPRIMLGGGIILMSILVIEVGQPLLKKLRRLQ